MDVHNQNKISSDFKLLNLAPLIQQLWVKTFSIWFTIYNIYDIIYH